MGNRRGQFNMPHPVAPDLGLDHFHTAFFADHSPVFHAFIFTAVALIVFGGAENFRTEQPVTLRLERAIIYRLGLFYFPMGPFTDLLR